MNKIATQNEYLNLRGVQVAICGQMQGTRSVLRSGFGQLGFRALHSLDTLDELLTHLEHSALDLLVVEVEHSSGHVLEVVHQLRHGMLGQEPFAAVIALAWSPTNDVVRQVLDSGVDSLLTLPVTWGTLKGAVDNLIHRRKPFVVTTDYVGPDRRTKLRAGSQQIPLIEVPNPLREKALGEPESSRRTCLALINWQKVERHAFQIGYLVDRVAECVSQQDGSDLDRHLQKLCRTAEDLRRRLPTTDDHEAVIACRPLMAWASVLASRDTIPSHQQLTELRDKNENLQATLSSLTASQVG